MVEHEHLVREQRAAMLVYHCWCGHLQEAFFKTLRTLRHHYFNGRWDKAEAAKLVRRNLREAAQKAKERIRIDPIVLNMAEADMMNAVERMLANEKGNI